MFFLLTNIETSCRATQIWNEVGFWFTQFMFYNVYMSLLIQCPKKEKRQRFWYLNSYRIPWWTSLYIELCCLWVIFLFTIPEIYYDNNLGMFLWGEGWIMISDPRSLSWFIKGADESVTREDSSVPLIHQWSWITDPDPDNPKDMHPLPLLNFLLNKTSK